jgi:hypothetical protein
VVVAYLGSARLGIFPFGSVLDANSLGLILNNLLALPRQPDFWVWMYFTFTISSTMMPSASDRRGWMPVMLVLAGLLCLAIIVGAGSWMFTTLTPALNRVFESIAGVFLISLLVHLLLGLPVGLATLFLSKATGLTVK